MKVNLMDTQLFIHRKTVITLLPFPPSLSFALFCNTLETHISLTPLWPLTVLIGPTTFRWKAGLRWPFFRLSADPSILSTERQKNKQEPVAWKMYSFITSLILTFWFYGPNWEIRKLERNMKLLIQLMLVEMKLNKCFHSVIRQV